MRHYIGIDPGKTGAIAVLDEHRQGVILPMPPSEGLVCETLKNVVFEYFGATRPIQTGSVGVEYQHAFPGRGASSSWTFAQGYGFLRGVLVTLGVDFDDVTPQEWIKGLRLSWRERRGLHKPWIPQAQMWFPHLKPNKFTADAVLIAEFMRRKHLGELPCTSTSTEAPATEQSSQ